MDYVTLGRDLVEWYLKNKRELPWRVHISENAGQQAYAIWISEIMLQQTTVAAVIPYYERWMKRFPDIHSLAQSSVDDVLRHWSGLGYYARARNLHKTAKIVVEQYNGIMPKDRTLIMSLPGIGPYTAGAILSIAYNLPAPIADVNVVRILSRIFGIQSDIPTDTNILKKIWRISEEAIPEGQASDFNQAMMELGALICDPDTPNCTNCPVNQYCIACKSGDPTAYPRKRIKKWTEQNDVSIAIRRNDGCFLIARRPESESLWGGLWELPRVVCENEEPIQQSIIRAAEGTGILIKSPKPFGTVKHVVASRKITLYGYMVEHNAGCSQPNGYDDVAWVNDIKNYAMATPQKKLFGQLINNSIQTTMELFD